MTPADKAAAWEQAARFVEAGSAMLHVSPEARKYLRETIVPVLRKKAGKTKWRNGRVAK